MIKRKWNTEEVLEKFFGLDKKEVESFMLRKNKQITEEEENEIEYRTACFVCGNSMDLIMVNHRNRNDFIIGTVFTCRSCYSTVSDMIWSK